MFLHIILPKILSNISDRKWSIQFLKMPFYTVSSPSNNLQPIRRYSPLKSTVFRHHNECSCSHYHIGGYGQAIRLGVGGGCTYLDRLGQFRRAGRIYTCVRVWNRKNQIRSHVAALVNGYYTVVYSINYKLPDRNKCDLTIRLNYVHACILKCVLNPTLVSTFAAVYTAILVFKFYHMKNTYYYYRHRIIKFEKP